MAIFSSDSTPGDAGRMAAKVAKQTIFTIKQAMTNANPLFRKFHRPSLSLNFNLMSSVCCGGIEAPVTCAGVGA